MKKIIHWGICVTWSDGEKEWLDYIPSSRDIENYLDSLEHDRNEEEKYQKELETDKKYQKESK